MLKKECRLNLGKKLKFTNSLNSIFFTLKINKNNLLFNRYGFVISKRIDKRAVVRNRIRRMFQKCLKDNLGEIKEGYDMLFYPKKEVLSLSQNEICLNIKEFFKKTGYLK
ncbi:MAG: ribonuclease P protein component [Candidatus Levyibacteriota bacterium]